MDYETPDGSQFSLQEVFHDSDGTASPVFSYTSVTALVNGSAFAGKSPQRMSEVDEIEVLNLLRPVPLENINPLIPDGFTQVRLDAVTHNTNDYYLKAPSFMYEDTEPGRTFVADCLLNEARVLEQLRGHTHPNIAHYFGCVVKDGRITQICLKRYQCSLADYAERSLSQQQRRDIHEGVVAAVKHLHGLGLAHNDVCPHNVCVDDQGRPAIVDFDSCLPFGEKLLKGVAADAYGGHQVSAKENDLQGLEDFKYFLDSLDDE
jgi:serine/threonine protein kinase